MDDCKRYGIDCLHEITSRNVNVAIEAGAKKFLQDYPIEGYANIEAAIQDKEYQPYVVFFIPLPFFFRVKRRTFLVHYQRDEYLI